MARYWMNGVGMACALTASALHATPLTPGQHNLLQGFLMRSCIKRTPASDGASERSDVQIQKYCQCASEHLANTFSSEEVMGVLTGQIRKDDPRGKKRLAEASAACSHHLEASAAD
ncbi:MULTISPECIES: hypothetical protein [Aquitalea]|uniref:hypothetical protein n=1 Tax=Aquitalea TaxID=407217 RepID=UPI00103A5376|nr:MULTISPECIES: hypothetical protein [Aquitalea]